VKSAFYQTSPAPAINVRPLLRIIFHLKGWLCTFHLHSSVGRPAGFSLFPAQTKTCVNSAASVASFSLVQNLHFFSRTCLGALLTDWFLLTEEQKCRGLCALLCNPASAEVQAGSCHRGLTDAQSRSSTKLCRLWSQTVSGLSVF